MKNISLCFFLLFFSLLSVLKAQTASVATGGNVSGSGGTVSYSIGQVSYISVSGTNGSIIEGVQQPFEISVVTAVKNSEGIKLEFTVYPNPAADYVKLYIGTDEFQRLHFQLFNMNGLRLLEGKIEDKETEISMKGFSSSTYFLKVLNHRKEIKTFKIIKK
jgi:hypothetical protein